MRGGQQKVEWECEKFSRNWGSCVRGSVRRGAGLSGGQQKVE